MSRLWPARRMGQNTVSRVQGAAAYVVCRRGVDSNSSGLSGMDGDQNVSSHCGLNSKQLPHSPLPDSKKNLLIQDFSRLLQRENDLAAVMGLVRNQVTEESCRVRLKAFNFAAFL